MVKVNVSVIMEFTDEWYEQFYAYWKVLKQFADENGKLCAPDEGCEPLDALAREYEMKTVNHIL